MCRWVVWHCVTKPAAAARVNFAAVPSSLSLDRYLLQWGAREERGCGTLASFDKIADGRCCSSGLIPDLDLMCEQTCAFKLRQRGSERIRRVRLTNEDEKERIARKVWDVKMQNEGAGGQMRQSRTAVALPRGRLKRRSDHDFRASVL